MVQILRGELVREDITSKAMGGTELIATKMVEHIDPELLSKFQVVHSRVRGELDPNLRKVFVAHDLPGDPEAEFLKQGGYNRFDKIVFVSNWQMQRYIDHYSIPWYKCAVVQNAIEPLEQSFNEATGPDSIVNLIYHTTPHRGLDILCAAFEHIAAKDPNVRLNVYSSFAIYGWGQRDADFAQLFDFLNQHPQVSNNGTVSNDEVRRALSGSDIFAYPSTWPETSCMSLMEAMSAGLICVHPNLAALSETAANWTWMYQYQENKRDHTRLFAAMLESAIGAIRSGRNLVTLDNQKAYADTFYNWAARKHEWEAVLRSLI